MNFLLALAFAAIGLCAYIDAVWNVRCAPVLEDQLTGQKIGGCIFMMMAVGIMGLGYRPVERGEGNPIQFTLPALWAAMTIAVVQCVLLSLYLQRIGFGAPRTFPLLVSFLIVIGDVGMVLLINGVLDFAPPQRRVVRVVAKHHFNGGAKSSPKYTLLLSDWATPGETVRLAVNSERYDHTSRGAKVELQIGRGLLGIEWFKAARFL
jgi:hypothetical protein